MSPLYPFTSLQGSATEGWTGERRMLGRGSDYPAGPWTVQHSLPAAWSRCCNAPQPPAWGQQGSRGCPSGGEGDKWEAEARKRGSASRMQCQVFHGPLRHIPLCPCAAEGCPTPCPRLPHLEVTGDEGSHISDLVLQLRHEAEELPHEALRELGVVAPIQRRDIKEPRDGEQPPVYVVAARRGPRLSGWTTDTRLHRRNIPTARPILLAIPFCFLFWTVQFPTSNLSLYLSFPPRANGAAPRQQRLSLPFWCGSRAVPRLLRDPASPGDRQTWQTKVGGGSRRIQPEKWRGGEGGREGGFERRLPQAEKDHKDPSRQQEQRGRLIVLLRSPPDHIMWSPSEPEKGVQASRQGLVPRHDLPEAQAVEPQEGSKV